jgi:type I restriction enzyme S subunit
VKWESSRLDSLCTAFADGDWIESKDQSDSGIRLIQTGNVGEGDFKGRETKARYISEETFKRLRCTEIFAGDCLVSRLPDPVGRSCILPAIGERMITAVDCTIVRFDQKRMLAKFFCAFTQSDDYLSAIDRETSGTTRKRISRSKLGETQIPVPPLPEQQRIVTILDQAFAAIATAKANTEKNLANARALFQSHLHAVFERGDRSGDDPGVGVTTASQGKRDVCRLGDVCEYDRTQGVHRGLPYVGMEHIESNTGRFLGSLDPVSVKSNTFRFTSKHVLYGRLRPYLNKVLVPDFDGHCSTEIFPFLPKRSMSREFLRYWLASDEIVERINATCTGARMPRANMDAVLDFEIPLPPLPEQQRIVTCLDQVSSNTRRLETDYQKKLDALDALKKSLLHQAFTGQMTSKQADKTLETV